MHFRNIITYDKKYEASTCGYNLIKSDPIIRSRRLLLATYVSGACDLILIRLLWVPSTPFLVLSFSDPRPPFPTTTSHRILTVCCFTEITISEKYLNYNFSNLITLSWLPPYNTIDKNLNNSGIWRRNSKSFIYHLITLRKPLIPSREILYKGSQLILSLDLISINGWNYSIITSQLLLHVTKEAIPNIFQHSKRM